GNGSVAIVDLATGRLAHRMTGLKEPQGVAYVPVADLVAVASAGDGSVRFYRAVDFTAAGVVELGDDADNIRVTADGNRIVVGYGKGGLALIDARQARLLSRFPLPAHPEGFQLHPVDARAFVNLPDARQIGAVDTAGGSMI